MFKKYENINFRSETINLIELCNEILEDYANEGYSVTVRQLYYQLVARDVIENSLKSYSRISSVINRARMAGLMDWDMIVDRGRATKRDPHWLTPKRVIQSSLDWFSIDKWQYQPIHIEVMCEKQALEGVLQPACEKHDLPFTANKGYSSQSFMHAKGVELGDIIYGNRKDVFIIYFGDHDPSGLDMDRDVKERLSIFSDNPDINFIRVALTIDQIDKYNPPPNPTKLSDSRASEYIILHGNSSWELDALDPSTLVEILDYWVDNIMNEHGSKTIWEDTLNMEKRMRNELSLIHDQMSEDKWTKDINLLYEHMYELIDSK
jgi:hypothetical protein